jgi:hypothetical protein
MLFHFVYLCGKSCSAFPILPPLFFHRLHTPDTMHGSFVLPEVMPVPGLVRATVDIATLYRKPC